MICAVVIDWPGSPDFPDGDAQALGRALATYPLMAAKSSAAIHRRFAMSSSQTIKSAALQYSAVILDPPPDADKKSSDQYLAYAAKVVAAEAAKEGERLDLLIALSAQAPAVTVEMIAESLDALRENSKLDSALSVSHLPRLFLGAALAENPDGAFTARGGEMPDPAAWFPNWSLLILKPGLLPAAVESGAAFGWLGKKSFVIKQPGVWPIEYQWQIPSAESWLRRHGFSNAAPEPEPQLLPQKQAKPSQIRPIL